MHDATGDALVEGGYLVLTTRGALFPDLPDNPRLAALIAAWVPLIHGLVMAVPISGREAVDARRRTTRPILGEAAEQLPDD